MAVESPPFALQGSTYPAEQTRRALGTLLQRGASIGSIVSGLVGSTDMQVTAGSGMQVLVAPGEAWVSGTSTATQSGMYCRVTSSTALAISASSESFPRIDTIIAKCIDKAYAGTEETFSVAVVAGTAESGATLANKKGAGAVPASSMVLAYVLVPAKATSIEAADIENVAKQFAAAWPGPRRMIERQSGYLPAGSGEFTYLFTGGGSLLRSGGTAKIGLGILYLNPADYAVSGRSTKLIIKGNVLVNEVAPTTNFSFNLFAVSTFQGPENEVGAILGSLVETTATLTAPGAKTLNTLESAAFAFPSAGYYALTVGMTGSIAAKSLVNLNAQMFVVNT